MNKLTLENTICNTWFERDRAMVVIEDAKTYESIAEFWDDVVRECVEDGYLDPRNYHKSAIDYLNMLWGLK